ncbi:MAG: uracil-DNA glycosylase [Pleomorphochaeta sp.]
MNKEQSEKFNDILNTAKLAFSDDYLCPKVEKKVEKVNNFSKFNFKEVLLNNLDKKEIRNSQTDQKEYKPVKNNIKENLSDYSSLDYFELEKLVLNCSKCDAALIRKSIIYGEGNKNVKLMVIGEGPGKDEDYNNKIFVGKSGQYLRKWLSSINLNIENDVYLSNIVKCFSNSNPTNEMVNACLPYLERQIELINPKVILILGKIAANNLLKLNLPMKNLRGNIYSYKRVPCVVTYHPAAVLRNPEWRRPVWEDLKKASKLINI